MKRTRRRTFLAGLAAVAAGTAVRRLSATAGRVPGVPSSPARGSAIAPPRLRPGDTIGVINPAGAIFHPDEIAIVRESMGALGLKVKLGEHVLNRYGYLAGVDAERAADVNAMFADATVRGIICVRGGWGCARILPLIDWALVRSHPKVLLGFSDITALHCAVQSQAGFITFHGPVGMSRWNEFNVGWVRRVIFDGEAATFENTKTFDPKESLTQIDNRTQTLTPGRARGRLLGGNLTVLTTILGSKYMPDFDGAILFTEDVHEQIYRIDRMLVQLKLAGVLGRIRGFVFGNCGECDAGEGSIGSLTFEEVLAEHIAPLRIPAWSGAQFGHIDRQFTLPEGLEVEIDAEKATITMTGPAVQ